MLEEDTEHSVRMRAQLDNLNPSGDCGTAESEAIPNNFVGVLLGRNEVSELEKAVLANTPKKPAALSITNDGAEQTTARLVRGLMKARSNAKGYALSLLPRARSYYPWSDIPAYLEYF